MTLVVRYEGGKKIYRSYGTPGSSEEDRAKADKLDGLLKEKISELIDNLEKEDIFLDRKGGGNVYIYWRLGRILHEILYKSGLVIPAEKPLFWLNAEIHVPSVLMKENRGPERSHLEYCCRLGGFSREKAEKVNWGEWVYLFDSPGINRERRFDLWFNKKMDQEAKEFHRISVRIFVQCLNNMLGNIETADLMDEELERCYDAAWELRRRIIVHEGKVSSQELKQLKTKVKVGIKQNYAKIGEVMENRISAKDFADAVLEYL